MKKLSGLILLALLLALSAPTWAENSVAIEVIKVDGVSLVVLTPEETLQRARGIAMSAKATTDIPAAIALPQALTIIEEEAFAGIAASRIEITESVTAIEARAFADCENLQAILIPESVLKIDDTAFTGCQGVTVYGVKGTEAERIAVLYGFTFVDPFGIPYAPTPQKIPEAPVLPAVSFD